MLPLIPLIVGGFVIKKLVDAVSFSEEPCNCAECQRKRNGGGDSYSSEYGGDGGPYTGGGGGGRWTQNEISIRDNIAMGMAVKED